MIDNNQQHAPVPQFPVPLHVDKKSCDVTQESHETNAVYYAKCCSRHATIANTALEKRDYTTALSHFKAAYQFACKVEEESLLDTQQRAISMYTKQYYKILSTDIPLIYADDNTLGNNYPERSRVFCYQSGKTRFAYINGIGKLSTAVVHCELQDVQQVVRNRIINNGIAFGAELLEDCYIYVDSNDVELRVPNSNTVYNMLSSLLSSNAVANKNPSLYAHARVQTWQFVKETDSNKAYWSLLIGTIRKEFDVTTTSAERPVTDYVGLPFMRDVAWTYGRYDTVENMKSMNYMHPYEEDEYLYGLNRQGE